MINKSKIILVLSLIMLVALFVLLRQNSVEANPATAYKSKQHSAKEVLVNEGATQGDVKGADLTVTQQAQSLLTKIEMVLANIGTRSYKIELLMGILKQAQSDDVKISALQALATLSPIEYTAQIIEIAKSQNESNKVRVAAVRTLNEAYFLSDEQALAIGMSTINYQQGQISDYINALVTASPKNEALYAVALEGYPYTNPDKALTLASLMLAQNTVLSTAEQDFLINNAFSDKNTITKNLDQLQKNPSKITDSMAGKMAMYATTDVILPQLSSADIIIIINLLKSHQFDTNSYLGAAERDGVLTRIEALKEYQGKLTL